MLPARDRISSLGVTLLGICISAILNGAGCCPTSCLCDVTTVTCQFLSEFPVDISPNTTHLIIKWSTMPEISSDDFDGLSSLEILDLSQNNITYVHPNAFNSLQAIYYISLENNQLTVLDNRTFVNLKLHRLYLSENHGLEHIHPNAFVNSTVEHLFIRRCSVSSSSLTDTVNVLANSLMSLDISDNMAPLTFEINTFARLTVQELTLQNNDISDISFLAHSTVEMLDLSENHVGEQAWNILAYIPRIRELILRDVGLTQLNSHINSDTLLVLNVASNNITSVEGSHLEMVPNLYTLILENNSIISLPGDLASRVPRLIVLDASYNKLTSFQSTMISSLSLQVLKLSFNDITSLSEDTARALDGILNVDLRGNPLHCNCQLAWLADWLRNLPTDRRDVEAGHCATPEENAGKDLRVMASADFICRRPVVVLVASSGFEVGHEASLECKSKGDPSPSIEVSVNNTELITSGYTIKEYQFETSVIYKIENFRCEQIGNYTCKAINMVGTEEETVEIGGSLVESCIYGWWSTTKGVQELTDNSNLGNITTPKPADNVTDGGETRGNGNTDGDNKAAYIIPVVICLAILIFFALCALFIVWNKKTKRKYNVRESQSDMEEELEGAAGVGNTGFNGQSPKSQRGSPQKQSLPPTNGLSEKQSMSTNNVFSQSPHKQSMPTSNVMSQSPHKQQVFPAQSPSGSYHHQSMPPVQRPPGSPVGQRPSPNNIPQGSPHKQSLSSNTAVPVTTHVVNANV